MTHRSPRAAVFLAALVLCAWLAPTTPAQSVWVVDLPGQGADFTSLKSAAAAASEGDILLLRAPYIEGDPVVIDGKSLTILADTKHEVDLFDGLTVRNLAAGQRVVLQGLTIEPDFLGDFPGYGLLAEDCEGAVWLSECALRANNASCEGGDAQRALRAVRSDAVVVTGGELVGADGDGPCWPSVGRAGLWSVDTRIALFGSTVTGGDGDTGGSAAEVYGGLLYALGCTFAGGAGEGGPSGAGMLADAATLVLYWNQLVSTPPGSELVTTGGVVLGVQAIPPRLDVTSPVREGEVATVSLWAARPGAAVTLIVGAVPRFQMLLAYGAPLAVHPAQASIQVPLGVVTADGTLDAALPVGVLPPGMEGATLFAQALAVSPGSSAALSQPRPIVVLDDTF